MGTPLLSIKLFYLTHPHVLLGFFHLERKDQDLLGRTIANNTLTVTVLLNVHVLRGLVESP
jgi:hypothetical protein